MQLMLSNIKRKKEKQVKQSRCLLNIYANTLCSESPDQITQNNFYNISDKCCN